MKKITGVLLALTCFALAFTLSGCNSDEGFVEKAYASGNAKISAVAIAVADREITVQDSDDGQVHLEYSENEKEYYEFAVSENNELSIKLLEKKNWTDFIGGKASLKNRKLILRLPKALLTNLSLVTTNENIHLSSQVSAESVSLSVNGGSITFAPISIGKELTLQAKNGNVQGTVLGSYEDFSIACTVKKGNSNLPEQKTDGEKLLSINVNNGDIKVDFVKP